VKTTRQQIIEILGTRRAATVIELSRILHLTVADVRHHLNILAAEGVAEVLGRRISKGRGRPSLLYGLVEQAQQHNLDRLASALLSEIGRKIEELDYPDLLNRLAARLAKSPSNSSRASTKRMNQAIQQLNEMNYQARWEAHSEAPHIIFSHCPYAAILSDHPELCRLDVQLLVTMLGSTVIQTAQLRPNPLGIPQCIFVIQK
jgi:predicted ArsR family transcriptional regulator